MESDIMDKITDFLDDHSIITYKWLSREIGVDFQKAKLLLKKYLDAHAKKDEIHATYCIIGREKNEKSINRKAVVVRECDVEKIKSRMDSTSTQHVYSVQKADLKNSTALYSIDLEINKHNFQIEPTTDEITPTTQRTASPVRAQSPAKTTTTNNEIKSANEKKKSKKEEVKNKQNTRNGKAEKSASFFANNKVKKTPPAKKEAVAKEIDVPKRKRPSPVNKNGKTYQRIKRPRIESSSSGGESEADEDDENRDFFKLENVESEKEAPKEPEHDQAAEEPKSTAFVTQQETVKETFVDDDGYLVTKKTVKRTTEPVKPDIKNQPKPKPKPTQKKALATKKNAQQPTLTSFFKRT